MTGDVGQHQLPVALLPAPDELLSSWISQHATFYGVMPLEMLRHCLPDARSLRTVDVQLTEDQSRRLSTILSRSPEAVRRMTFANLEPSARRLFAALPGQYCANCASDRNDPSLVMRSQLSGWRITCPLCGSPLRDLQNRDLPCPFDHHWAAALRGERLIDNEAERAVRTWASPAAIAGLLLMRRRPDAEYSHSQSERFRVLGVLIPELDDVIAALRLSLPSPASPILPLQIRPALLAGVAIVERGGPAMIEMLHARLIGENRTRFGRLAGPMMVAVQGARRAVQLHLI